MWNRSRLYYRLFRDFFRRVLITVPMLAITYVLAYRTLSAPHFEEIDESDDLASDDLDSTTVCVDPDIEIPVELDAEKSDVTQ